MEEQKLNFEDVLHREFGKALSCEERASFFSSKAAAQSDSNPKTPISINPDVETLIDETKGAYANAWEMLVTRLEEVTTEYERLIRIFKFLRILKIGIPDRDYNFTIESTRAVKNRFDELMLLLSGLPKPKKEDIGDLIGDYTRTWSGLYNICHLFMEEISFLCKRIESLENTLNVVKGWTLTFSALVISAFLAITAIVVNIFKDRLLPKTSSPPEVATIIQKLDLLIANENTLGKKVDAILPEVNAVKTQTFNSEKSINKQTRITVENAAASFRTEVLIIREQATRLEKALATNTAQLPKDIREIREEIKSLNVTLSQLAANIENRKLPPINIQLPQQPITKSWGIGVIRQEYPTPTPEPARR